MRKFSFVLAGLCFLFLSVNVTAQSKSGADYFEGKWSVLVKGTPQGDAKLNFTLVKKDSSITGMVQDSTGNDISKVDRSELKGDQLTVYFVASGYDLNLVMTKKDEDHVTGSLLGMFSANGDRIKEMKK